MELDYNNFITRVHIDMIAYNEKFSKCDRYLAGEKELLPELLKCKTCFSYLFFSLNGKRIKLYTYQDMIIADGHKFKIFRAARQIGKSIALDIKAAYNLCIDHGYGHNESIISKSMEQAKFQMTRIKQLLNSAKFEWKEDKGPQDNTTLLTVSIKDDKGKELYVNRCVVAPHTESALGYDFHEVNLDETEYWIDVDINHFYHDIIEPTTYATKGTINSFSNPNGADSFVADLEKLEDKDGNKIWHTYIFDFLDCPNNTEEELEMRKIGKSRQQIESQLLAIRSLSDRNYFSPDEIENSYDKSVNELNMVGKQPFFFLDVGAKRDQSVLIGGYIEPDDQNEKLMHIYIPIIHVYPVGYPLSRVVGSKSNKQDSDGWHVEKSVSDYLTEYSIDGICPEFGCDVTGNSGIVPLFETIDIFPTDVTFSGPVKSGMYQRFKYFMEKGLIHRKKSEEWEYQAAHMEVKKSLRGYLMIHHENESDLDDCMDATAGFIYLADNPDAIQPGCTFVGDEKDE